MTKKTDRNMNVVVGQRGTRQVVVNFDLTEKRRRNRSLTTDFFFFLDGAAETT